MCRSRIRACLGACTRPVTGRQHLSVLSMLAMVLNIQVRQSGQAGQSPHTGMKKLDSARQGDYALAHGSVLLCSRTEWQQPHYQAVAHESQLTLHSVIWVKSVKAIIKPTTTFTSKGSPVMQV